MPVGVTGTSRFVVEASQTPTITNLSVSTSETSHVLTNGLKQVIIRARGNARLQIAFVATESTTNYVTIPIGSNLSLEGLEFSGKTVYITASKADTVEILELN